MSVLEYAPFWLGAIVGLVLYFELVWGRPVRALLKRFLKERSEHVGEFYNGKDD